MPAAVGCLMADVGAPGCAAGAPRQHCRALHQAPPAPADLLSELGWSPSLQQAASNSNLQQGLCAGLLQQPLTTGAQQPGLWAALLQQRIMNLPQPKDALRSMLRDRLAKPASAQLLAWAAVHDTSSSSSEDMEETALHRLPSSRKYTCEATDKPAIKAQARASTVLTQHVGCKRHTMEPEPVSDRPKRVRRSSSVDSSTSGSQLTVHELVSHQQRLCTEHGVQQRLTSWLDEQTAAAQHAAANAVNSATSCERSCTPADRDRSMH